MSDVVLTRINGTPYSATSCGWLIALSPYVGITKFSYADKRDRKIVHASRKDGTPLGITSGKYMVDACSITMLVASFDILTTQLTALGLGSYGDAVFPIVATYSEVAAQLQGVAPIVTMIDGCRITGVKESYDEGIDEKVVDVDFMAMAITRNGKRLWSVVNGVGI